MELLSKLNTAKQDQILRKRMTTACSSSDEIIEKLSRIRKNLLLKSNKNVSRFTINARVSVRLTDEQVRTITSMLPDEVNNHALDYKIRNFEAAVIFADISGFTDLSDKYQGYENGASKLSMVLNFYLGSMVQEILSHGGDIIKYAGDAFLAIFRAENDSTLQEAIYRAINASLIIQKNCKNYRTDVSGVTLNVKIAISGGEVNFSLIGNESSSHYVIVGDPVWQVKTLQEIIKPGEVLVSSKAWFYAQESLYIYQFIKDYRHYKVLAFKDDLEVAQRQHEAILNFNEMQKQLDKDQGSISATVQDPSYDPFTLDAAVNKHETYSLRKSISSPMDNKSRKFLRRFIITPVLNGIDLNEPIEVLTEMRHVVILFANFIVLETSSRELIKIVDAIYNTLSRIVSTHEGIVNKVSLFDKDMMFLVIFGLRGFKHELESRVGLRCASEVHETFQAWSNITTVSIGVTSGMSYCGVVGHTLRREYSVISVAVNKAARLMIAYPNVVSCDQETLLNSKLELKHFSTLPKKTLKGLRHEVVAYEFKEIYDEMLMETPVSYNYPLVGRNEVLSHARSLLVDAISNFNEEIKQLKPTQPKISCFLIKDELQQGKTRILNEIHSKCFNDKLNCIRLTLNANHAKLSYKVISTILENALSLGRNSTHETVEWALKETFDGLNVEEYLSVFNSIFDVHFEVSDIMKVMDEAEHLKILKVMFKILCTQAFQEFTVVMVDNLEYLSQDTFELIETLFETDAIFMFATLGKQKKIKIEQKSILNHHQVMQYRLQSIDTMFHNQLACHFLNVSALSLELEKYLHKNSVGNPGWIETNSIALIRSNKVQIKSMTVAEVLRQGMTWIDNTTEPEILTSDSIRNEHLMFNQCYLKSQPNQDEHNKELVVNVAVLENLWDHNEFIINTRSDSDLMTYDSLTYYQQLVCKCSSVLGVEFTRHMLHNIMSSSTDRMIGKAMVTLFDLQIFVCASSIDLTLQPTSQSEVISCFCKNIKRLESCRDLPLYSCCAIFKFQSKEFRSMVYDSLTDKQRLEYHRRSMIYLHMETRRCDSCGNGPFLNLMLVDFDFKFHDGIFEHKNPSYESMIKYFESINIQIKRPPKKNILKKISSLFQKEETKIRSIVLNFMNYDFRRCKCTLILYSMYSEMINHCHGGETILKLIDSKIELASMCIKVSNIPRASSLLHKALKKIDANSINESSLFSQYLRGRALRLQGVCLTSMMQNKNGLELYYQSCETFHVSFPKTYDLIAKIKLRIVIRNVRKLCQEIDTKKCSRLFSLTATQLSKTMSCMFDSLFEMKHYKLAKLAAFWSLQESLKLKRSFSDVARSFANVMKIVFHLNNVNDFLWLQDAALEQTSRALFSEDLNLYALTEVIKMYKALMMFQISRREIRAAIQFGEISKKLCSSIQLTSLQTEIVPSLFLFMMNMKRIQDATALLQRFANAMKFTNDKNGIIWYHALSMDMLLDTSLTIVSYQTCDQYFLSEITTFHKDGTPESLARFFANLLLWSVRHQVHEIAQVWMKNLAMCFSIEKRDSINTTFTGLRIMEAFTIQLAFAVKDRNMDLFLFFDGEMKQIVKQLSLCLKNSKCFVERFELHRMHFELVKSFKEKRLKKLDELLNLALKNKNYCAYDIIQHTQRFWKCELSTSVRDFWINHSSNENEINLSECAYNDRIFPFSLPIPKLGNF